MAHSRSAIKRARQSMERRERNRKMRAHVKSAGKRFSDALTSGDRAASEQQLRSAIAVLDRAVTRGALHRNTAARRKSRIARQFNKAVNQD